MKAGASLLDDTDLLADKIAFLSRPEAYDGETSSVELIDTHMSVVFLTDHFAYKFKKPVWFDFLDFSTLDMRHRFCLKEVSINRVLAGDTYLRVIPLTSHDGHLRLGGAGDVVEWIVKMRRLPKNILLGEAIRDGMVPKEWAQLAAEKLVKFYLSAPPVHKDILTFRNGIIEDIELNSAALLNPDLKLSIPLVVSATTDLLLFIIKHADLFERRVKNERIIDGHGDLRPEHICLGPDPLIIDRIEFNDNFRIMDVAEEISFFAMECEMLHAAEIGQMLIQRYRQESHDEIPDILIRFYKAKRAFLRAKLSIQHLLEPKYIDSAKTWRTRCNTYLDATVRHSKCLT